MDPKRSDLVEKIKESIRNHIDIGNMVKISDLEEQIESIFPGQMDTITLAIVSLVRESEFKEM